MLYEHIFKKEQILGLYCIDFLHLDSIAVLYSEQEENKLMDILIWHSLHCQIHTPIKETSVRISKLDWMTWTETQLQGMISQRDNSSKTHPKEREE